MTPEITKQEFLEAISDGVTKAIWKIATDASYTPCADFYDMIKLGCEEGIKKIHNIKQYSNSINHEGPLC